MEMGRQGRVRCPVCGKQFTAGRRTYCSDQCRKRAQMRRYRARQAGRLPAASRTPQAPVAVPRPQRWVDGLPEDLQAARGRPMTHEELHDELYDLAEISAQIAGLSRQMRDRIERLQRDELWTQDPGFTSLDQALGHALFLAASEAPPLLEAITAVTGTTPKPSPYGS